MPSPGLCHMADGNDAPFHHCHAGEAAGIIPICGQHGRSAANAARVVTQSRREQGNGEFFIGKLHLRRQGLFRLGAIRVMTTAPLGGENLQLSRTQSKSARLRQ